MKLAAFSILALASIAQANVNLELDIVCNDQKYSCPTKRIEINEQMTMLDESTLKIDATLVSSSADEALFNFTVIKKDATSEIVISQPIVVAKFGEVAKVNLKSDTDSLELAIATNRP